MNISKVAKISLKVMLWNATLDAYICGQNMCVNPLRPNNDLTQTSHCNIKGVSVSEVMRIEDMITQVQFYWYFNSFSPLLLYEMYGNTKREFIV